MDIRAEEISRMRQEVMKVIGDRMQDMEEEKNRLIKWEYRLKEKEQEIREEWERLDRGRQDLCFQIDLLEERESKLEKQEKEWKEKESKVEIDQDVLREMELFEKDITRLEQMLSLPTRDREDDEDTSRSLSGDESQDEEEDYLSSSSMEDCPCKECCPEEKEKEKTQERQNVRKTIQKKKKKKRKQTRKNRRKK